MAETKKKKINPLIIGGGVLFVIVLGAFLLRGKKKEITGLPGGVEEEEMLPEQMIDFDETQEPEIELSLDSSLSRGSLIITGIDPIFSGLEYEFIYVSDYQGSMIERGISSGGSIDIPDTQKLTKSLVFGVESCTTDTCHFTAEKVEIDQPAMLILRFLDEEDNVWELEKELTFKKEGTSYIGVFED